MNQSIKNAIKYCPLLKQLIMRDLKVKYRRSVLGYLWSLLNPLFMMMIVSIIFSVLFKRYSIVNFPLYVLCGQILFAFFSESTTNAMYSVLGNSALIKKVYIPKYIFPLSRTASSMVTMLISLIAIGIMLIVFKVKVSLSILLLPLLLMYVFIFSLGVGLILSVVAVFFRDIIHLYSVLLTAWTYFTPIFYPAEMLEGIAWSILQFNPMYHYVTYFRNITIYSITPSLIENMICFLFSIISLTIGLILFKTKQHKFMLYI